MDNRIFLAESSRLKSGLKNFSGEGPSGFCLVFFIALLVRGLYFYQQWANPLATMPVGDSAVYVMAAEKILVDGDWLGSGVFTYGGSAFYIYFLALVFLLFGKNFVLIQACQYLAGAAGSVVLMLVGRRLYNGRAGLVIGIWAALLPLFFYHEGLLLTSSWAIFFLSLSLYFLFLHPFGWAGWTGLATGVLLGLTALCRPNILLLAPVYLLIVLSPDWRAGLKSFAPYGLILGMLLIILPVTGRNYLAGNDLVLISSGAGWNFYLGNNPEAPGFLHVPGESGVRNDFTIYQSAHRQAELAVGHKLAPSEASRYWFGRGLAFLKDEPFKALALYGRKFELFFNSREISDMYNYNFFSRYSWLLKNPLLSFGILALSGLAGSGLLLATGDRRQRYLVLLAATYMVSVLPFFVHSRLREPMAIFLLLLSGGFFVEGRLTGLKLKSRLVLLTAIIPVAVLIFQPLPPEAARLSDSLSHTYYTLGRKLAKAGNFREAGQLFAQALEGDSRNIMIMVAAGQAAEGAGEMKKAGRYYEQILPYKRFLAPTVRITPSFSWPDPRQMAVYDADLRLGVLSLNQGELARATSHLAAAVARYPIGLEAHYFLSLAHERAGRYPEALAACLAYLKIMPSDRRMRRRVEALRRKIGG